MDDSVPTEDEIDWMVTRLHNHRSGGPSGMRDDHLKGGLAAARKKEMVEAADKQENLAEGMTTAGPGGTG